MTEVSEYDAIAEVVQHYLDGAVSGKSHEMRPAFHADATMLGYEGTELLTGPVQGLFEWVDEMGPAPDITSRITSIDVSGTVATVRIEIDRWHGDRYTDLFTLLKVDGEWKIKHTGYERTFELYLPFQQSPGVKLVTRWDG